MMKINIIIITIVRFQNYMLKLSKCINNSTFRSSKLIINKQQIKQCFHKCLIEMLISLKSYQSVELFNTNW